MHIENLVYYLTSTVSQEVIMEFENDLPIYVQIVDWIKADIISGKIKRGDKLLSTRELAMELKVNPNTVQRVYKELENEEICQTRRGMGTYVTEEESRILALRDELAKRLVSQFVEKMLGLNYTIGDIIVKIENEEKET